MLFSIAFPLACGCTAGSYDPEESLSVNVAVASPLLSRFDIIMVLLDTRSEEWDDYVSSFILAQSTAGMGNSDKEKQLWTMSKLKV